MPTLMTEPPRADHPQSRVSDDVDRQKSKRTIGIALAAVGSLITLAVAVVGLYMLVLQSPSDHAVYYPKSAGLYVEIRPSQEAIKRSVDTIKDALAVFQISVKKDDLALVLQKDMAQSFSFASWPLKQALSNLNVDTKKELPLGARHGMALAAIVSLKPNVTLSTILNDLGANTDGFETQARYGFTMLTAKSPRSSLPVLAMHNQHLIVAPSMVVMDEIIQAIRSKATLDSYQPFKSRMETLSKSRDGAFYFVNRAPMPLFQQQPANSPLNTVSLVVKQLQLVTPITVGELHLDVPASPASSVIVRAVGQTPFAWQNIRNPRTVADLKKLMVTSESLSQASVLPSTALGFVALHDMAGIYQFYFKHVATPQASLSLAQAKQQFGVMNLDYDKHVMGFLQHSVGVAIVPIGRSAQWIGLLNTTKDTPEALQRIETYVAKRFHGKITQETQADFKRSIMETHVLPPLGYQSLPNQQLMVGRADVLKAITPGLKQPLDQDGVYRLLHWGMPDKAKAVLYVNSAMALETLFPRHGMWELGLSEQEQQRLSATRQFMTHMGGFMWVASVPSDKQLKTFMSLKLQ